MLARNKTFNNMTVVIDGSSFYNCTFNRCKMQFAGLLPGTLEGGTFNDCQWQFAPPASNAIEFMAAIYKLGGAEMIENTFRAIRGDNPKTSTAQH
jgi:hypothetical protein